jgi:uncharacterized protein YndB with AHSA1/START domain
MHDIIRLEHRYRHPISVVWEAISDEKAISEWFIKANFKAEVGYAYTFTHESTVITGTVKSVEPPRRLVYTWIVGDPSVETTVSWALAEDGDGTLLVLEHSGISDYGDSAPNFYRNFEGGWQHCASELERYLGG